MLVGDASSRAKVGNGKKTQSCFRCYSSTNFGGDNAAPCQDANLDTESFPTKPCLGGIRSNILYPTYVPAYQFNETTLTLRIAAGME